MGRSGGRTFQAEGPSRLITYKSPETGTAVVFSEKGEVAEEECAHGHGAADEEGWWSDHSVLPRSWVRAMDQL